MALERAMKRLSLDPSSVCRQCRRSLTSAPASRQQQSATGAFADLIQSSRAQTANQNPHQPSRTPRTATLPANAAPASPNSPAAKAPSVFELSSNVINSVEASRKREKQAQALETLNQDFNRKDMEGQQFRRWRSGDVYAPHDLSGVEMAKWKRVKQKARPRWDVLDQLNIKPMDHYKNFSIMSEYVTEMGRIKHSKDTGLRPRNHRKMAKAVRRAIGLGLIPSTYRHPEILKTEPDYRRRMLKSLSG